MPTDDKKTQITHFMNKDHIKQIIVQEDLINLIPQMDHLALIHSAFINNPYNLVNGVLSNNRADDQRGRLDTPIVNQQKENFKEKIKKFKNNPTIANFAEIDIPPEHFFSYNVPLSFKKKCQGVRIFKRF